MPIILFAGRGCVVVWGKEWVNKIDVVFLYIEIGSLDSVSSTGKYAEKIFKSSFLIFQQLSAVTCFKKIHTAWKISSISYCC